MDEIYVIHLPFPPSVNNLFSQAQMKSKRTGKMVTRRFPTKKYASWRKEAVTILRVARFPKVAGAVAVKLTLTPPSSARRDADNYSKAVLDALVEAGVLADDSQVQKILCQWDHERAYPGCLVEIGPATARPPLKAGERKALAKLKRDGSRLISPLQRLSKTDEALIAKGYALRILGLLDETPQGIAPIES